jgi:hypothetical protein
MAKVTFFTNLDEAKPYIFDLNQRWSGAVPSVGHQVEVAFDPNRRQRGSTFLLRVVAVTWRNLGHDAEVELHMHQNGMSIRDWMEWFKRIEQRA